RPCLDGLLGPVFVQLRNPLEEFLVDVWTFFSASAHSITFWKLHVDRLRPLLMRAELAATQDQFLTGFAGTAGDATLGEHARLGARMTAAVGAAFAAAHRMVDRVHRFGAGVRTLAHVALAAGLADAHVDPVDVAK